jgi:alpha-beta hydrolase superfamily lysophospholipase
MPEIHRVDGLSVSEIAPPVGAEPRPPVLFVHGMFGTAWYWEPWQEFFAERGWPAYAVSLRGRGTSRPETPPGSISLRDFVDDALAAAAFLAGRHDAKPVVVGHSMGGLIAQAVAEAGAAEAIALLCSAPPKGINPLSLPVAWRMLPRVGALLASRPVTMTLEDDSALALNRIPPGQRAAIHAQMVPESGRIARELALGGLRIDARRVGCPVISVTAGEDRFVPPRIGRQIAQKYHAPHWHYAEHAHFLVAEPGWERIAGDVERWAAHVTLRALQPARDDALWRDLKGGIGDLADLEFFDGYRVRGEIVSVDLAARQRFVYAPVEVQAPGARARYTARDNGGDVEWSPLVELVRLNVLDGR